MFTNTYEPLIGGIERSVQTVTEDLRSLGHRTLVVTPAAGDLAESDQLVFRMPAIRNVLQFSLTLPLPAGLAERLDEFGPDLLHSHHPFMLGDTALRHAIKRDLPLVFTHHTLWERYFENTPLEKALLDRLVRFLPTQYANLSDLVIAPTRSIAEIIIERGVTSPIEIVPTGVAAELYASGDRVGFRRQHAIPESAFVLGHLGRLVPAKNLAFMADAVAEILRHEPSCYFLAVGEGESREVMQDQFDQAGFGDRVRLPGLKRGRDAVDAYAAMDLFLFTSKTDTQGLVLIESFAAGVPVVAIDAPGARDLVRSGQDGTLVQDDLGQFVAAVRQLVRDPGRRSRFSATARGRAEDFSRENCVQCLVAAYQRVLKAYQPRRPARASLVERWWVALETEWTLIAEKLEALARATEDRT
jgi:1,2-diacylglycerol 3-alpha-glucosyltransferase